MIRVTKTVERFVRTQGLYTDAIIDLEKVLGDVANTEHAQNVYKELIGFITQEASKAQENEKQDDARLQKQADAKKERQDRRRGNDDRRRDQVQRQKDREQDREQEKEKDAEKDSEVDIATTVATAAAQGVAAALNKGKDGDKEDDKKEKKEQMLSFQDYLEQAPTNSASANNIAGLGDDEPIVRGQARRMKDCSKCKGEGCAICTPTAFIRRASKVAESVMRQITAKRIAQNVQESARADKQVAVFVRGIKDKSKKKFAQAFAKSHGRKMDSPSKFGISDDDAAGLRSSIDRIQNDFAEAVENLDVPAVAPCDIPADAEPTTKTYAGSPVFKVSPETFAKCSGGRKKWARWSKTLNLEDEGQAAIRTYANKYPSRPIVLQCDETGDMKFLRFNRKGGGGNRKRRKSALPTPTDGGIGQIVFDADNEQVTEGAVEDMVKFLGSRPDRALISPRTSPSGRELKGIVNGFDTGIEILDYINTFVPFSEREWSFFVDGKKNRDLARSRKPADKEKLLMAILKKIS